MLRESRARMGLRRTVALLSAYLIALQAMVGTLALPLPADLAAANATICHSIDGDSDPSQSPTLPAGTCDHCTLCHVMSAAALPAPVAMLRPDEVRPVHLDPTATDAPRPATERPFSARAPPGLV
jgi:hypothetical protein